jgi:hypothetical protein
VVARPAASQPWCGRRPSMTTSYTAYRRHRLILAQPGQGLARSRAFQSPQRAALQPTSPCRWGGTHAGHGAQQRGLARAIGADDGRPAAGGQCQVRPLSTCARPAHLRRALAGRGPLMRPPSRHGATRCISHSR